MIKIDSKRIKMGDDFKELSWDVIPGILSFFQKIDFSYLSRDFCKANQLVMITEIFKMKELFKDKYLFFQRFISDLNLNDNEEKIEIFIRQCFLDISKVFKEKFSKYYENIIIKKYSENSFASEKIKEMVQVILDVNTISLGILFYSYENDDNIFIKQLKNVANKYLPEETNEDYYEDDLDVLDHEDEDEDIENRIFAEKIEEINDFIILNKDAKIVRKCLLGYEDLKNIEELELNRLKFFFTLPLEMNNFVSLKSFILWNSDIKYISVELPNLEYFELSHSNIDTIPLDINFCMPNLIKLNLSCNAIKIILKNILFLRKLKKLDLSNNEIAKLPKWFFYFYTVVEVAISSNYLKEVDDKTLQAIDYFKKNFKF